MLAFAIIPGMQTRVVTTASTAPTLAVAVNASGFQIAAAFAGWLGGRVIGSELGLRSIYLLALSSPWRARHRALRAAARPQDARA